MNHAIQRRTLQEELDSLVVKTPGADAPPKGDLETKHGGFGKGPAVILVPGVGRVRHSGLSGAGIMARRNSGGCSPLGNGFMTGEGVIGPIAAILIIKTLSAF